jgi:hypothetical protein
VLQLQLLTAPLSHQLESKSIGEANTRTRSSSTLTKSPRNNCNVDQNQLFER